eukprot:EST46564.1 Hypothetical protein SS50377_13368 [Spironucleus salmonicida]
MDDYDSYSQQLLSQTTTVQVRGEHYIDLEYIFTNFTEAYNLSGIIISSQFKNLPSCRKQYHLDEEILNKSSFQWNSLKSQCFAVVATALGIQKVKPVSIQRYMPSEWNLSPIIIGNHLQKYRLTLIKEQLLQSGSDIQNTMVPTKFKEIVAIKEIIGYWQDNLFVEFSYQQIQSYVQSLIMEFKSE